MMTIREQDVNRIYKEQKGQCWVCGKSLEQGYHVHHGVYTREARFVRWLDMAENLFLICPVCHEKHGYLTSKETRDLAWTYKLIKGYDMEKWHNKIPMLVKDRFVDLRKEI